MFFNKKLVFIMIAALSLLITQNSEAKFKVRPQDQAVFHNNQGVKYLNSGDAKRALFEFKTAVEISDEYPEGWNNLGLAYLYLNQNEKAKAAFLQAIKYDSKYAAAYNHLATLYYNQKNFEEALSWAQKAIKKDKKFADAHYNEGLIYRELYQKTQNPKYSELGEEAFRLATEANYKHYLAHYELGKFYHAQGKYEQALIRYKTALEIQPSAHQVWLALGKLYEANGQASKAQFAYNKAMAANPKATQNHLSLGLNYIKENNFLLGNQELQKAYSEKPNDIEVLSALAYSKLAEAEYVRNRQGQGAANALYEKAIQRYQALLQRFPNSASAAHDLGYTFWRMENYAESEKWYLKALSIDASHSQALYSLGILKLHLNQREEGHRYLCQFLKTSSSANSNQRQAAENLIAQIGKCK